jgi:hypothetical protein
MIFNCLLNLVLFKTIYMKKITMIALMLVAFMGTKAQVMYPYSFTKLTAPYANLVGATNLTSGVSWDDTTIVVPVGFNFKWALDSRIVDSIAIDSYGMLYKPSDYDVVNDFPTRIMMPYQVDLADRSYNTNQIPVSPISYQTTGNPGSKICKIEFRNAGFYSDSTGMDSTNFQIWLYEGSNVIEYRYGPQSVADIATSFDGENGPWINLTYQATINLANQTVTLDTCTYIAGNASTAAAVNPTTAVNLLLPPSDFAFVGLPDNGQVFRFAPKSIGASVNEIEALFASIKVYPTQFNESVNIEHQGQLASVTMVDINGKIILSEKNLVNKTQLNTSSLSKGIYLLKLTDYNSNTKSYKLIK